MFIAKVVNNAREKEKTTCEPLLTFQFVPYRPFKANESIFHLKSTHILLLIL